MNIALRTGVGAIVALALVGSPAPGNIADGYWSGNISGSLSGAGLAPGDFEGNGIPLRITLSEPDAQLTTTDSEWSLSGPEFGTLSGDFGTMVPGNYVGLADGPSSVAWSAALLDAHYADATGETASGILQFRTNRDGSRVRVSMSMFFTGTVLGGQDAGGVVRLKGRFRK